MNKQARAIGEQVVISICLIVFAYVHEVLRTKQKVLSTDSLLFCWQLCFARKDNIKLTGRYTEEIDENSRENAIMVLDIVSTHTRA